jgi:hypothetical protein
VEEGLDSMLKGIGSSAKSKSISLIVTDAKVEPSLKGTKPGNRYQFERIGYFCMDPVDSLLAKRVFIRTVAGHALNIENPKKFNEIVLKFLLILS